MMGHAVWISAPLTKADAARRQVTGVATVEQPDLQGDIVDYAASVEAFRKWPGNVREQHDKQKTIGSCVAWAPDPEQKAIRVTVKVSRSRDGEDAWVKIMEGVLRGFSIGGQALETRPQVIKSGGSTRTLNRITRYRLDELSLVDNPACPSAQIELVKSAGGGISTPTGILEKMFNQQEDFDDPRHPREIITGGNGISGTAYHLVAKSADGAFGLYRADRGRGRSTFIVRHASGARQWTDRPQAVLKAHAWLWLPGEYLESDDDIADALTTRSDGVRPGVSPRGTTTRQTEPGSVKTTDDGGRVAGDNPLARQVSYLIDRTHGASRGRHSSDPVLDRSQNRPWGNQP